MIRRPPRSTQSRSSAASDVYKRQFLLDDDTIRGWHGLFVSKGLEGLARFEAGGSACQISDEQQEKLKAWVAAALPRTTRQVGAWIEKEFGIGYEGRSGLIALLHRLGPVSYTHLTLPTIYSV